MQPPASRDAPVGKQRSTRVVWAALAGNLAIAVSKMVAAMFTGSSAMWSESVHSLVDTGNQWLLLLGMRRSARPASEAHPFGHGLELYFWSFVVAVMIFGLGAGVSIYQGISKLLRPEAMSRIWVNYIVLGVGIVFEGTVWLIALREFRKESRRLGWIRAVRLSKDPAVFTVLFEDTAALAGLLVAFIGVALTQWSGRSLYDGLASVLIGLILAATATLLANEIRGLLTGEAASRPVREKIRQLLCGHAAVREVHRVWTMHFAPNDILLAVSIKFDERLSMAELEDAIVELEDAIRRQQPEIQRIFLEPRRWPLLSTTGRDAS
ncbi:cation diffusion facilitator family transporter [Dyella sp. EPa41]|uniref:cation diffusion facilitator family transporter n=1 Tax=Dyella sp. EPa41 TaxID=1561194 RepID=UPI00191635F2|nr:cation diffusion facilitator family transporter [Dyella sp. EPa41]